MASGSFRIHGAIVLILSRTAVTVDEMLPGIRILIQHFDYVALCNHPAVFLELLGVLSQFILKDDGVFEGGPRCVYLSSCVAVGERVQEYGRVIDRCCVCSDAFVILSRAELGREA